ncbi:MAG: DUF6004 family protein, partial [Pseudomonadota bacterium]
TDDGYSEFDTELISAPEVGIKGYSYTLDDRIQVLSNPAKPNTGSVKQVIPGRNFPANFTIRRFGILESSTHRMVHRDVISMKAVVDQIPPFQKPMSQPYLGTPRGDGPMSVVPALGVVAGQDLPEAWYPADDNNEIIAGTSPSCFFDSSMGPCMSMLVDPSLIMSITVEGKIGIEVDGRTETIDLRGDYNKAAGAEILLFGPEKHDDGTGVQAQLARLAMSGESKLLGGRVMLRASWPRPSRGSFGEGGEKSLDSLSYPGSLDFDANFELVTPNGVLYADNSMHIGGHLRDLDPTGAELSTSGPDAPLVTADGQAKARLSAAQLVMRQSVVGEHAPVTV